MGQQISAANPRMSTAPLFAKQLALIHIHGMAKRKAQKSELDDWQLEDAARLRELIAQAKARRGWQGMDEFANRHIGKSGSYLSQLAGAYRPLNLQHAIALAKGLAVDLDNISPTLAQSLAGVPIPAPPSAPAQVRDTAARNRRDSEYDRSVFRALDTVDPAVKISIQNMILAIAAAKNPRHLEWSSAIEDFNNKRDAKTPSDAKKKAVTREK